MGAHAFVHREKSKNSWIFIQNSFDKLLIFYFRKFKFSVIFWKWNSWKARKGNASKKDKKSKKIKQVSLASLNSRVKVRESRFGIGVVGKSEKMESFRLSWKEPRRVGKFLLKLVSFEFHSELSNLKLSKLSLFPTIRIRLSL